MAEFSVDSSLERRLVAHRLVAWQHGIVGGLVAGIVMGLSLMVTMAVTGEGFFRPLEIIGSVWYGAVTTGRTVIILGLLTHLGVAAILGAIWAYAFSYIKVEPIISGLAFGAIVWVAMQYLVLPFVADYVIKAVSAHQMFYFGAISGFSLWMVLGAYLIFGATLGVFEELADRRQVQRVPRS